MTHGWLLQPSLPGTQELLLLLLMGGLLVLAPIVWMYRESAAHSDHALAWTSAMAVVALAVPIAGPIGLWLLYTAVEVGWPSADGTPPE